MGVEPPPKPDLGLEDLLKTKMESFKGYMNSLDKWFKVLADAVPKMATSELTIDPGSIAANTTAEQQFVVLGLTPQDVIVVNKPTFTAGFGIVGARCSAIDALDITFINATGSPIDPGSEVYTIFTARL